MEVDLQLTGSLATRLGTNYAPTETEIAEIKTLLKEPLAKFQQLEQEIALSQAKLEGMRNQKDALERAMQDCRALLSPVRRIPRDLLQEIFLACLPEQRNPSMSTDEAPMLLTHISSQWRHVALNTPRLWAAIHIPVPSVPRNHLGEPLNEEFSRKVAEVVEQRIAAANEWFERSGACPLSISLHEWNAHWSNEVFRTVAARCLLPVRSRWKDISLTTSVASLRPIQDLTASDTPLLESLRLQLTSLNFISGPMTDVEAPWSQGSILQSPSLTRLQISGSDRDIPYGVVNWEHLTTLLIDGNSFGASSYPNITEIKTVLRKCSALVECTVQTGFQDMVPVGASEPYEPPIVLPHLETLTVEEEYSSSILSLLQAPSIKRITYSRGLAGDQMPPSPLLRFLASHPDTGIRELSTSCTSMNASEFTECLRCSPSLRVLHIKTSKYVPPTVNVRQDPSLAALTDNLLTALAPPSADVEVLCPQLEDVAFMMDAVFSEDAVLAFIRRKQSGDDTRLSKLRKIKINFGRKKPANKDVVADVQPYVEEGLRAELLYDPPLIKGPLSLYDGLPMTYVPYGIHSVYVA